MAQQLESRDARIQELELQVQSLRFGGGGMAAPEPELAEGVPVAPGAGATAPEDADTAAAGDA